MADERIQHFQLVANTVKVFTLDKGYNTVEVLNRDGVAEVFLTADGEVPTVAGADCHVLPAAIGALEIPAPGPNTQPTVVRLISSGTPKVSVRGL